MGRIARTSRVDCDKGGDSSADANVLRNGVQFANTPIKATTDRFQRDGRFQASPENTKSICKTGSNRQGQVSLWTLLTASAAFQPATGTVEKR